MENRQGIQLIDESLIDRIRSKASTSQRLRMNHNFHSGAEDNPHRFLNVLMRDTYVTPHRHAAPPKAEAFLVLEGCAAVVTFADDGQVAQIYLLSGDGKAPAGLAHHPVGRGVDLPPGVWHTVVVLSPAVVCYEVKPGPWIPSTDKEFAPWAPAEDHPSAPQYLQSLLRVISESPN